MAVAAWPRLDTDLILIVSHLVTVPASHRMLQKRLYTGVEVAKLAVAAVKFVGQLSQEQKSAYQCKAIHVREQFHTQLCLSCML